MSSIRGKILQVILVLTVSVFMIVPIQGYDMFRNIDDLEIEMDKDLNIDGSRILTDDEVMELDLGDVPTRSLPEKEWERFGYHRGGESGAAAYNATSDRLYLYGGGSERSGWGGSITHSAYSDMFYYDLNTNRWTALEYSGTLEDQYPEARYRMSYATDETRGKMYIYGGYKGESSASMVNDLWEFDMDTEKWTRLVSSGPLSDEEKRVEAPMVIDPTQGDKGMLYIHMGRGDSPERNNMSRFYQIDLANPTSISSLPAGENDGIAKRWGHDMAIDTANDKIYIFGGIHKVDDDNYQYLRDMWVYNMLNPGWTEITLPVEMPMMQGAKMYIARNGSINLWGGREASPGTSENETLWIYDPDLELWTWVHYPNSGDERPDGRAYYARHYSKEDEKFFVFAGRYWSGNNQGRYRDVNYLDTHTYSLQWTQFPLNNTATSRDNGIFAYNSALNRLYYIGPTGAYNGTEYVYYFDLKTRDWFGPFYDPGGGGPESTSRAGIAYIEDENTIYMYGGGYETGNQQNRRYWTRDELWKLNLDTFDWTQIYDEAFPGEKQGIELLYNPDTKLLYFYGGYAFLDPAEYSSRQIFDDFWSYNPSTDQFKKINQPAMFPEGRIGTSLVYDYDDKVMYLFGGEYLQTGGPTSKLENDLWKYDFTANIWTEIDASYKPSDRDYGKMAYDPLTKELYLLGGGENDDFVRYRILEERWYTDWYPKPNPGSITGHAIFFDTTTRDLWLFGGGAKSGMWRMGMPARLAIQEIDFTNAEDDNTLAYAMLKTYDFKVTTKTVTGPADLDQMKFDLTHANGKFTLIYTRSEDYPGGEPWTELDNGDYAELTSDPTVTIDDKLITFDIPLMFHWNWTHKSSQIERTVDVRCTGFGVDEDILKVTHFLSVRNKLELKGEIEIRGEYQGMIMNNSWVRSDEDITIHGPVVSYQGTDIHPPVSTYQVTLWDENDDSYASTAPAGEEINITIPAPNSTKTGYSYVLNITGVPENTDTTELELKLNIDGNSPEAPAILTLHADKADDTRTDFDNDLDIIATWQTAFETGSGIKAYYWAFTDLGGTRLGTELNVTTKADIHLPTNGSHTMYIWAEDMVGNIGPAANSSIVIDDEAIVFDLLSPDLDVTIPYGSIDIMLNITDYGGSMINRFSVQYRYTSGGLNDEVNWQGSEAWKYFQEIWDLEDSSNFLVELELKDLSQGADNFFQFRAVDGAGSEYESEVFNLEVDFDLAYPKVTMVGPENYAEFSDAEDVLLSWTVDFFEPKDVVYTIYMSTNKDWVVNLDSRAVWKEVPIDTEYQPTGLTFGTYYWNVIPVAKGEYTGESLTGFYVFNLTNEESYAFDVNAEDSILRFQQGTVGIPMNFDITNKGNFDSMIMPVLLTEDIVNIEWEGLPDNGYMVRVGSSYTAIAMMTVPSNTTVGNYTLIFQFESDMGVIRTSEIALQITERIEVKPTPGNDPDYSLFIVGGIIAVIILIAIIGALYFFVFKKKEKKDDITLEHELNELEKEYGISSGLAVAPQPKGGALKSEPKKQALSPVEEEEVLDEFQDVEEEPMLAAPGSEDEWMNVVAAETVALESQAAVEEDKLVETDGQPKEISDILGDMLGDDV